MAPRDRRNLIAALGFLQVAPRAPELQMLHRWLDTWSGTGAVVAGLHRAGYDLHLTQYGDDTWRATFSTSPVSRTRSSAAPRGSLQRGRAVQRAGWDALQHAERSF
jgi:hypothetical protein